MKQIDYQCKECGMDLQCVGTSVIKGKAVFVVACKCGSREIPDENQGREIEELQRKDMYLGCPVCWLSVLVKDGIFQCSKKPAMTNEGKPFFQYRCRQGHEWFCSKVKGIRVLPLD